MSSTFFFLFAFLAQVSCSLANGSRFSNLLQSHPEQSAQSPFGVLQIPPAGGSILFSRCLRNQRWAICRNEATLYYFIILVFNFPIRVISEKAKVN